MKKKTKSRKSKCSVAVSTITPERDQRKTEKLAAGPARPQCGKLRFGFSVEFSNRGREGLCKRYLQSQFLPRTSTRATVHGPNTETNSAEGRDQPRGQPERQPMVWNSEVPSCSGYLRTLRRSVRRYRKRRSTSDSYATRNAKTRATRICRLKIPGGSGTATSKGLRE